MVTLFDLWRTINPNAASPHQNLHKLLDFLYLP
jgi:hypothetical protein